MTRLRRNDAERRFEEWALSMGWSVSKRGWPDFWCMTPDGFLAVEVKPDNKNGAQGRLKSSQMTVLQILAKHGIKVSVWTPKHGMIDTARARVSRKFRREGEEGETDA